MLDEATDPWGVKVERVEVKDVRLPVHLQRAMATEAEAAREARAKVGSRKGDERRDFTAVQSELVKIRFVPSFADNEISEISLELYLDI